MEALFDNSTGGNNIGVGFRAGFNLTTGSNNIEIGNSGVAGESGTIRIGTQGIHTRTFVGGIFGSMVTGDAVVVSNTGQLGIVVSSARYKRDIHGMGVKSDGLLKLRPVTFRYKTDPAGTLEYGLVAEEVAKFYPQLVSYGPDGKPMTVRYLTLISMLINELQKQAAQNQRQAARLAGFEQRLSALERTTGGGRTGLRTE
jgi:hypothetical protein